MKQPSPKSIRIPEEAQAWIEYRSGVEGVKFGRYVNNLIHEDMRREGSYCDAGYLAYLEERRKRKAEDGD